MPSINFTHSKLRVRCAATYLRSGGLVSDRAVIWTRLCWCSCSLSLKDESERVVPTSSCITESITESGLCFSPLTYLKITKTSELPNLMTLYGPLLPLETLVLASKTWFSPGVRPSSQASLKLLHSVCCIGPVKFSLHMWVASLSRPNPPCFYQPPWRRSSCLFTFQTQLFSCLVATPGCEDSGT